MKTSNENLYYSGSIQDGNLKFPQHPKTYLETSCQKWNQYPEEEKVLDLGYLVTHGFDLLTYVKNYLADRPDNKLYILHAFIEHIGYLRDPEGGDYGILRLSLDDKITVPQAVSLFCKEVGLRYEQRYHYSDNSLNRQIVQHLKILPPWNYTALEELKLPKKEYYDIFKLSTYEYMQTFVHCQLKKLLETLKEGFDGDELAYLSAQTKNEQPIRDKIAWRLHKIVSAQNNENNVYVVRREWAPKGSKREQGKVDLAVLEMDSALENVVRVIALVEFKAQSIVKRENWYLTEFKHDIQKMRGFVEKDVACKAADIYFVFLETGQDRKADKFKSELGFAQYQTKSVKYFSDPDYLAAIKEYWDEFPKALNEQIVIHEPQAIDIGEAFGYRQYVSSLLIGPLK